MCLDRYMIYFWKIFTTHLPARNMCHANFIISTGEAIPKACFRWSREQFDAEWTWLNKQTRSPISGVDLITSNSYTNIVENYSKILVYWNMKKCIEVMEFLKGFVFGWNTWNFRRIQLIWLTMVSILLVGGVQLILYIFSDLWY